MANSASKMKLPARPPRYRFALTPLADAMFQLLIFFMLSSSLTPYSLITLRTGAAVAVEGQEGQDTAPPPDPNEVQVVGEQALWNILKDAIIISGTVFDPEDLPALAEALGDETAPADVILIVEDNAEVQDVATVLEVLQDANVGSVQVTRAAEEEG